MLVAMAVRRHPEKGARWASKINTSNQGTPQLGICTTEKQRMEKKELVLLKAADTPIQRHVKIKAGANPHDPHGKPYFETDGARG